MLFDCVSAARLCQGSVDCATRSETDIQPQKRFVLLLYSAMILFMLVYFQNNNNNYDNFIYTPKSEVKLCSVLITNLYT